MSSNVHSTVFINGFFKRTLYYYIFVIDRCCIIYFSDTDQASTSNESFTSSVNSAKVKRYNVSLLRALHKCFWLQFYSIGILKLTADCAGFAGPILLNKLVSFIENREENVSDGYAYAAGLCAFTLLGKT